MFGVLCDCQFSHHDIIRNLPAWSRKFHTFSCMECFMTIKRCANCNDEFRPRPQVPKQTYCPLPECQQRRRSRWEQKKRQTDPDYRENQSRVQKDWLERNPDYHRQYRADHPASTELNREKQRQRNKERRDNRIAKMDVSAQIIPLPSGKYRISPVPNDGIAKMDAWTVEITMLSISCDDSADDCKEST